jgi:transposase
MADQALQDLSLWLDQLYAKTGRPSIPPEQLLRAQILQVLYTVRSERQLMDQIDGLALSMVCGLESRRSSLGCDGIYQEP